MPIPFVLASNLVKLRRRIISSLQLLQVVHVYARVCGLPWGGTLGAPAAAAGAGVGDKGLGLRLTFRGLSLFL